MLGKLIKHDFKALGRTLWPTNIAVVAAGAVMAILLTITLRFNASENYTAGAQALMSVITGLPMVLIGLAIAASSLMTLLLVCFHYYRNFMGDEGYLTFTLPVKTSTLLWSKLLSGFFWMLINIAAIGLAVMLVLLFGSSTEGIINADFIELLSKIPIIGQRLSDYSEAVGLSALALLSGLLSIAGQLLKVYFAVTIGGMIAKQHKLLASIGMYFAVNIVAGIVNGVIKMICGLGLFVSSSPNALTGVAGMQAVLLYGIGTTLLFGALYFVLSELILRKRLNLQ